MNKNEIAVLSEKQESDLVQAVEKCHIASAMKNDTIKSLRLAHGMQQLKNVLNSPEVKSLIMSFQNMPFGFLTDRDNGYEEKTVLNCSLTALVAGAFLHGNEFNIIAGNAYFAQNFFVRKVREFCTEHKIKRNFVYEVKYLQACGKQNKYEVKVSIYWKFPEKDERETTIEKYILVGMTEDQVIGKATKRAHQWLFNELTNNNFVMIPDDQEPYFDMSDSIPNSETESKNINNPIEYLVEKFGVPNVLGYMKEQGYISLNQTLDDLKDADKTAISANLNDFIRDIEQFSKL